MVPDVTPADVLFFVRSISTKGHITYADFIELLSPPELEEGGVEAGTDTAAEATSPSAAAAGGADGAANGGGPAPLSRQTSRITPKGEKELEELEALAGIVPTE